MAKVLFVRGFNEKLHTRLDELAKKERTPTAVILENAFQKWLKEKERVPKKHVAVLYADEESLTNIMLRIKEILGDQWTHACFGPPTHFAIKFLKKNGWQDVTIQPFSLVKKQVLSYSKKMFAKRANAAKKKPISSMGFIAEHLAHTASLKKANLVEKAYNNNRSEGIAFCPYHMQDLSAAAIDDILELFEIHDQILIAKNKDVYELDVNKINLFKAFV